MHVLKHFYVIKHMLLLLGIFNLQANMLVKLLLHFSLVVRSAIERPLRQLQQWQYVYDNIGSLENKHDSGWQYIQLQWVK